MNDEETTSRTLVVQLDAGVAHVVRKNSRYTTLSTRLEQLRLGFLAGTRTRSQFLRGCAYCMAQLPVPLMDQGVQDGAAAQADENDILNIIPWVELDALLGVDVQPWQPWN
jgi:hypothetical protein